MVKDGLRRRNFRVQNIDVSGNVTGNVPGFKIADVSDIWYVDKSVVTGTSGDGSTWESAFKTITEAVAAAGNYDTIFIAPGFYTEAATQTITQVGLKIIGMNSSGKTRGPCSFKTPTAAGPMITIAVNANDVEIAGISFIATSGQKAIQLGGAASGYVWRTHVHDCAFYGDGSGTYAIAVYGATTTPAAGAFPDCAECVVERCYFYDWQTAATCVYGTRHMVKDNAIFVPASGVGIVQGNGRPFNVVSGNKILGAASGDTGILITGDDKASSLIENNTLLNLATTVTQDVGNESVASNNTIYEATTAYAHVDVQA